jgi:hypothetical protein
MKKQAVASIPHMTPGLILNQLSAQARFLKYMCGKSLIGDLKLSRNSKQQNKLKCWVLQIAG